MSSGGTQDGGSPAAGGAPLRRTLTILNQRGLHARAAAKFAQCAGAFDAEITVIRGPYSVNGTSIMGLMMLGAAQGVEVTVETSGPQADAAMAAIAALIGNRFGES
ncbi:HPr family phosphocarrier protein [Marinibaculum pumilum]|uniref:HPr family phosphocarrier protein n=1 Tax=Marinibaculum pumilum TaxID=1766165 RepID=A0ABV7L0Y1_9PROT